MRIPAKWLEKRIITNNQGHTIYWCPRKTHLLYIWKSTPYDSPDPPPPSSTEI